MVLSVSKCAVMSFCRSERIIEFNYQIEETCLERLTHVRDLGVILDTKLTFHLYYAETLESSNRMLGFVCKFARNFSDPHCLRSLYCALVRSRLETAAVVWSPYRAVWIRRFENIQRKFVRYGLRMLHWRNPQNLPCYEDRCALIGLQTLEWRRTVVKAVHVAKLINGELDCPTLLQNININAPTITTRRMPALRLPLRRNDYGLHDPLRSMQATFNELSSDFDFNFSADTFKRKLLARIH